MKLIPMRTALSLLFIACFVLNLASALTSAVEKKGAEVYSVRLYLPDDQLHRRLGDDVKPLADYVRALVLATKEYWDKSPAPEAKGLLIAVGIKPGKRSRVWCEAVQGRILIGILNNLEKALGAVPTIDVKEAPIAFAIELQLGASKVKEFPVIPTTWSAASKRPSEPLMIPDELFKVIWPD